MRQNRTPYLRNLLSSVGSQAITQWGGVGIIFLSLGFLTVFELYRDKVDAEANGRKYLESQARIIEENLTHQLGSTNRALSDINEELPNWGSGIIGQGLAREHLKAIVNAQTGVRTILIFDSEGTVIFGSREELIGKNFSDREYFQTALRSPVPDILQISKPFKTVLGVYAITVARPLVDPLGKFNGVITATIDPEYFALLMNSIRATPDTISSLIHGDGPLIYRIPDPKGAVGIDLATPKSFFTAHQDTGQTASFFVGNAATLDSTRMAVLRTMRSPSLSLDKPLVIAVGRDLSAVFAHWHRHMQLVIGSYVSLLLLAIFCLYYFQRMQRKKVAEREQVENALRESELRGRLVIEAGHVAVWDWNVAIDVVSWSPQLTKLTGHPSGEIKNGAVWWRDTIHPDDRDRIATQLVDYIRGRSKEWHAEYRLKRADGSWAHVVDWGQAIRDQSGWVIRMIGAIRDVTSSRQLELQLAESELRHRLVVEAAGVGLWEWTPGDDSAFWSAELIAQLGLVEGYATNVSRWWHKAIHPDDHDRVFSGRLDFLRGPDNTWNDTYRLQRTDGSYIHIVDWGHAIRNPEGRVIRMVGAIRDITDQKQTEERLRENEERYRTIFAESPVPMWTTEIGTMRFIEVNNSAVQAYGYSRDEFLGMTLRDIRPPEEIPRLERIFKESPTADHLEMFRHRKKDGSIFDVRVWSHVLKAGDKMLRLAHVQDFTAQLQREKVISEANKAKSAFLATMSHELRTPLNSIIGFSEIIAEQMFGPISNPKYVEYGRDINFGSKHLLSILDDVLDLSRIESGQLKLELRQLVPCEVIESIGPLIRGLANRHRLALVQTCDACPIIFADERALKQILLNLVSNAAKYTKPGGRIDLNTSQTDDTVTISVTDSGVGMRAEDIPRALEPFVRIGDPTISQVGGTGIGLSIIKKLTDLHGWTLHIDSELGRGTTVEIRIPLRIAQPVNGAILCAR